MSLGMFYSVICNEDMPWITEAERRDHIDNFVGAFPLDLMSRVSLAAR